MFIFSAGIGRTGTIVVIDMLIETIDIKGESLCLPLSLFSVSLSFSVSFLFIPLMLFHSPLALVSVTFIMLGAK